MTNSDLELIWKKINKLAECIQSMSTRIEAIERDMGFDRKAMKSISDSHLITGQAVVQISDTLKDMIKDITSHLNAQQSLPQNPMTSE
jgi:hypothetical protein